MRPYTTRALAFALTGIGWPALVIAFSLLWPGPIVPAQYAFEGLPGVHPTALPPVDRSGSLMHLEIQYDPNSASATVYVDGEEKVPVSRIFWDIPGAADTQPPGESTAEEDNVTPQS